MAANLHSFEVLGLFPGGRMRLRNEYSVDPLIKYLPLLLIGLAFVSNFTLANCIASFEAATLSTDIEVEMISGPADDSFEVSVNGSQGKLKYEMTGNRATISELSATGDPRNAKIAKSVLVHELLNDSNHVTMLVRRNDRETEFLLRDLGFKSTRIKKGFFRGGEDAIQMERAGEPLHVVTHGNIWSDPDKDKTPESSKSIVRWAKRSEWSDVLSLSKRTGAGLTLPKAIRALRQRDTIGMVVDRDDRNVGRMIYKLDSDGIHVVSMIADPDFINQGVELQMLQKLKGRLMATNRKKITFDVRETNLSALKFLTKHGFKVTAQTREAFEDTGEDMITMTYTRGGAN